MRRQIKVNGQERTAKLSAQVWAYNAALSEIGDRPDVIISMKERQFFEVIKVILDNEWVINVKELARATQIVEIGPENK